MDTITAAYLNRLGVEAERPSAEALARLHRAHVERVPYETFWIHLAQGWGIDPAESTRRVATTRRGGYCYQLNGAFGTLLTALGYRVSVNVAGVHEAGGPDVSTLRNHAALVVEGLPSDTNPGGRWWVDAGLGDALHDPMPMQDGVVAQGPMRFGMAEVGAEGVGDWHLTHDPSGSFTGVSLVDQPVAMDVFAARHLYNSTSPESGFAKTVTAQRRHATGYRAGPGLRLHPARRATSSRRGPASPSTSGSTCSRASSTWRSTTSLARRSPRSGARCAPRTRPGPRRARAPEGGRR